MSVSRPAGTSIRTFLDTNVLVYAFDNADTRKRDTARSILAGAEPGELVLSTQVLAEFYVVTTRKLPEPLPEQAAARAVEQLAFLPVVPADATLVLAAVRRSLSDQLSLWDAMVIEAAIAGGCRRLLTEDLSHGAGYGPVEVTNPFEPGSTGSGG